MEAECTHRSPGCFPDSRQGESKQNHETRLKKKYATASKILRCLLKNRGMRNCASSQSQKAEPFQLRCQNNQKNHNKFETQTGLLQQQACFPSIDPNY